MVWYNVGMTQKRYNTHKPYICIRCGNPTKRRRKYCSDCQQWGLENRPTYERTPEHRQLMSEVLTGKPKDYPTGGSDPEVAEKIRQAWTPEMKEAARQRGLENANDPEWRLKIARSVSGKKNPRWENGRSVLPYTPGFSNKVRELVWERDNGECQNCGSDQHLCVHHKDFSKDNHDLDNLVLICRSCHTIAHVAHSKNKNLQD